MALFEFVGGSQDGQRIEVSGDNPVGMELRLPSPHRERKVEVYVLRGDGKLHFDHYGHPPLIISRDKSLEEKNDKELTSLILKLVPCLAALEKHFLARGGFPPQIGIGQWILKRKDS